MSNSACLFLSNLGSINLTDWSSSSKSKVELDLLRWKKGSGYLAFRSWDRYHVHSKSWVGNKTNKGVQISAAKMDPKILSSLLLCSTNVWAHKLILATYHKPKTYPHSYNNTRPIVVALLLGWWCAMRDLKSVIKVKLF